MLFHYIYSAATRCMMQARCRSALLLSIISAALDRVQVSGRLSPSHIFAYSRFISGPKLTFSGVSCFGYLTSLRLEAFDLSGRPAHTPTSNLSHSLSFNLLSALGCGIFSHCSER